MFTYFLLFSAMSEANTYVSIEIERNACSYILSFIQK